MSAVSDVDIENILEKLRALKERKSGFDQRNHELSEKKDELLNSKKRRSQQDVDDLLRRVDKQQWASAHFFEEYEKLRKALEDILDRLRTSGLETQKDLRSPA